MSRPTLYWAKVVTLDGLRRSALNQARHFIRDPMRRVSAPLRSVQSNGPPDHLDPRPTRCFTLDLTGPCPGPTRLSTWTRAGTIPAPRQRLCPCILAESYSCTTLYFITFHTNKKSNKSLLCTVMIYCFIFASFLQATSLASITISHLFSFEKGQMVSTLCHRCVVSLIIPLSLPPKNSKFFPSRASLNL